MTAGAVKRAAEKQVFNDAMKRDDVKAFLASKGITL
jgi:hypothetical protein